MTTCHIAESPSMTARSPRDLCTVSKGNLAMYGTPFAVTGLFLAPFGELDESVSQTCLKLYGLGVLRAANTEHLPSAVR